MLTTVVTATEIVKISIDLSDRQRHVISIIVAVWAFTKHYVCCANVTEFTIRVIVIVYQRSASRMWMSIQAQFALYLSVGFSRLHSTPHRPIAMQFIVINYIYFYRCRRHRRRDVVVFGLYGNFTVPRDVCPFHYAIY